MTDTSAERQHQLMNEALEQLRTALDRLDCAEAPASIGARVDQAINELDALVRTKTASGVSSTSASE